MSDKDKRRLLPLSQNLFNLLEIYNIRKSTSKRARRFEAFNRSVVNLRED